jgi:hypothetical protein
VVVCLLFLSLVTLFFSLSSNSSLVLLSILVAGAAVVRPPPPRWQLYLDEDNFEHNPYGVECIRSVQMRIPVRGPNAGVKVVDTLMVYCLVNDILDRIKNYFSASLLPGGTGIVITVPSHSMLFQHNAASIHALEGGRLQDEATLRAHMIQNTLLNQPNTPRDLTKTIVLLFPANVVCETAIFNNGGAGGLELTTNFHMIQVDTT